MPVKQKSICVFCGASPHIDQKYLSFAQKTGKMIAQQSWRFVYGGGKIGLMGAAASAANNAGGDVLGIMPKFLLKIEQLYDEVPHRLVDNMHQRKQIMYHESDAFLVLPGGIGTLEETIEVLSWSILDLHQKPIVCLSEDQYWFPLKKLIEHMVKHKFANQKTIDHLYYTHSIKNAFTYIKTRFNQTKQPDFIHQS